jgi:hypothetical protein
MLNRFISAVAVLFLLAGFMIAAEYKGTLTKFDEGKSITVKVDDKTHTFKINDKTEFVRTGKGGKEAAVKTEVISKMLEKAADKGIGVEVKTEGEGSKEVVTKVNFVRGKGKGKDK